LPVIFVGIVASAMLMRRTGMHAIHPIVFQVSHAGWMSTIWLYLLAAVWAPLVEESVFRGAFYGDLRPRWGVAGAAIGVAFVFAAIHPQGLAGVPALMAIAIVFALVREWRGSLIGPMVAHAINNFLLITLMLLVLS
jgi:membrane protease YdiL (CAAX protease family)